MNYPVTVSLSKAPESVKTGMTANLNIIVNERKDVLTVPNRAVKTVNKRKVVTVLKNGQQVVVPVQTGVSNDSLTEIVSGLQEGDVVVINSSSTASTSTNTVWTWRVGRPRCGDTARAARRPVDDCSER